MGSNYNLNKYALLQKDIKSFSFNCFHVSFESSASRSKSEIKSSFSPQRQCLRHIVPRLFCLILSLRAILRRADNGNGPWRGRGCQSGRKEARVSRWLRQSVRLQMMVEEKPFFSLSHNQVAKVLIFLNEQPCVLNRLGWSQSRSWGKDLEQKVCFGFNPRKQK